jgi:predicted phosphodiesterase
MRVAALYDIHGNLPALEAVLDDVRAEHVDQIVVGGDVVCGPMTRGTMERLLDVDIPMSFILGNAEVAVLSEMAGSNTGFPEQIRAILLWETEQLREYQSLLASWPKTMRMQTGAGEVLFCHATPRDENEIFTRLTPEAAVLPAFASADTPLVVCGHTHMQFDRVIGGTRVVNAGSVGMPFCDSGAYWLLLGAEVELRRTEYDLERAAERIRATRYPQANEFAANNVLQPPSEAAMLEMFSKVELSQST